MKRKRKSENPSSAAQKEGGISFRQNEIPINTAVRREQRKNLVSSLKKSRKRFHTLHNSMAEMVVFHRMIFNDSGEAIDYRILDCNTAFTTITGIPRENAVGRLASELYATDNPPFLKEYARVVQTGESRTFEAHFEPMVKWFSISVIKTQKDHFATISFDITQRKNLEIESQKELDRKRFRLELFENVRDMSDEEVFNRVLNQAKTETESEIGSLHFIESGTGNVLYSVWNAGPTLKDGPSPAKNTGAFDTRGRWFDCLRFDSPVVCNDSGDQQIDNIGLPRELHVTRFITVSAFAQENMQIVVGVANKLLDYTQADVTQVQLAAKFLAASVRRRHLDRELRTSEEQHRLLFETISQGVMYFDMDGRVLSANPAAERILKIAGTELIGMTFLSPDWQIFAEDGSLLTYDEYPFGIVKRSGNPIYGFVLGLLRRGDNTPTWLSVSEIPIFRPGESAPYQVYSIFEDITEFKRTQSELKESEAKYRIVVENSLAGVYIFQDGLFRYVNKRWCEIYGYTEGEVVDRMSPLDVTPPEDRELVAENVRKRLSGEVTHLEYETRAVRKDGSILDLRIFGSRILYKGLPAISGTVLDVTEQRIAEEELKKKTALLEAQLNASPYGIIVVDNGKKILQNQKANELLRIPPHIAAGDDDEAQVQWVTSISKNPDKFYEKAQFVLDHPGEILKDEIELTDGTVLERYSGPISGFDGTYYGRLVMFHDITELRKTTRALEFSQRRLSETMELAEIVHWEHEIAGEVFNLNDAFYAFLGTTAAREGGYRMKRKEYISRFVHPDDRRMFSEVARSPSGKEPMPFHDEEHRIVHADGSIRHVHVRARINRDAAGNAVEIHGSMQNITQRKQAEEALLLTQSQLIDAMNLASIVNWDSDVRTGELIFNDMFYDFYGTTAQQEGGYRLTFDEYVRRFVHPDDRSFVRQFAAENSQRNDRSFAVGLEHRIIRRDGQVRHIRALTRIVRNESGQIVSRRGANQDVTERKRSEDEIRMLKHSIDVFHDSAYWLNTDHQYIYVNDAACKSLGYSREELLGSKVLLVNPHLSSSRLGTVWEQLRREGSLTDETIHRRKDGSEFPVEVMTTYVQFDGREYACGFARDITERKLVEEALKKSEERFVKAFKASPEAVSIVSLTDRTFLDVNEKFLEKTGFTREEVIGRTPSDLDFWVDEKSNERFIEEITSKGHLRDFEMQFRTRNGDIRDLSLSSEIIHIGAEQYILNFIFDQTDRKKLEAQLRQSQKMEAIGTLAGGIAHDFNNIITVVAGFVHLLRSAVAHNTKVKPEYIEHIATATDKATKLTRSLLAISRKQEISLEVHNLNKLVEDTSHLLKRLLTEDIDLRFSLSLKKPFIMADATQIDQILFNLVANARDAMPRNGGCIEIKTEVVDLDHSAMNLYGYDKPGTYVLLSVSDNGSGMDSATRERIFEPFFTTKDVGKGTGLGLSTVYGIVGQHGGHISVASEPGRGSTFSILFPVVDPARKRQNVSAEVFPQKGNETVFVVDDDTGVRGLISEVLRTSGYKILEASDGEEALKVFGRNANVIDLVIMDVVMPKLNGKDVSDEMKKIDPAVKIVFISGYTRDIVLEKGHAGIDFIKKPLLPDTLLAKVREVLDRRH